VIELVVFDMDGVLSRPNHARRLEILSRHSGKSPEHIHRAVWESDLEARAEVGAWRTGAEYLAEVNRVIGASLTREQWIEARRGTTTPIHETLGIARRLAARVPITTLTNNNALLRESIGEVFPEAAELFGASFLASCELGARKPERAAFANLARRFGVVHERVLFIDDHPKFVEGARAAGLHAIQFVDPARLEAELAAHGLGAPGH
jgi:putative hydrolase of the HAD superfamily